MFLDLVKDYSEIIILTLGVGIFVLLFWNIWLQTEIGNLKKKNQAIFAGKKGKDLEEVILDQVKNLKILDKDIQELYEISNQINQLALRSVHKVGIIRYNPFKEVGGNQSFAIALLNGKDNGIVISSLFTREGTRVYSKDIKSGISEKYPLTDEEKEAIKMAQKPVRSGSELKKIN